MYELLTNQGDWVTIRTFRRTKQNRDNDFYNSLSNKIDPLLRDDEVNTRNVNSGNIDFGFFTGGFGVPEPVQKRHGAYMRVYHIRVPKRSLC